MSVKRSRQFKIFDPSDMRCVLTSADFSTSLTGSAESSLKDSVSLFKSIMLVVLSCAAAAGNVGLSDSVAITSTSELDSGDILSLKILCVTVGLP